MARQTVTAFYDSREYAEQAAASLRTAGVTESDIILSPVDAQSSYRAEEAPAKGFWATLEELFGGSEDHAVYSEGVKRGGTLLTIHVEPDRLDVATGILEQHGSIDLDERESAWRDEGWDGGKVRASSAADVVGLAPPTGLAGDLQANPRVTPEVGTRKDGIVQVVEESLDVVKRAVNRGKVRLHAYVVEKPVSEQVTLRDEKVIVDRRPVNKALNAGDVLGTAFEDRTVELDETHEEAVLSKTARVVEEVSLRKDVSEQVKTISDTVRSTKVDVDDGRTVKSGLAHPSQFAQQLVENLEVVGSDAQHVGIIDRIEGETIKLKRVDVSALGQHHKIPVEWVSRVDSRAILSLTAAEAMRRWTSA